KSYCIAPASAAEPAAHLVEQRSRFLAAAGIRERPSRSGRGGEGMLQGLGGFPVASLAVQVVAVEKVRVDASGIDRQRAAQVLLGLVVVAEGQRPARHLVVQRAQRRVGRAGEGVLVDGDG